MDQKSAGLNITIFFCQQLDANQDANRRVLEKELGPRIKFFPLPCSGRIEPLHLLRALETGADRVYLIICPEGACRYREGNLRARKRLAFAQGLIEEIGLERERLELIQATQGEQLTIDQRVHDLLARKAVFGPNPIKLQWSRDQGVEGPSELHSNPGTHEPSNP
jgi:coenzyme F420-reducing hydrogenase delta subunit